MSPPAHNVAELSLMRTIPVIKQGDASERSLPCASWLGAGVASVHASHRSAIGRVSLGVAVMGGDASRRSPPGCTNLSNDCSFGYVRAGPMPVQQNSPTSPFAAHGAVLKPGITSTC